MRTPTRYSLWVGWLALLGTAAELQAATPLKVRLLTPISSYRSKAGDLVQALVSPAACSERSDALPDGTILAGLVRSVRRVGLGLAHETASLRFDFYELRLPDGRVFGVEAGLRGIDNARERVDRKGVVHGIRATNSLASRVGSRLAIEAFEHPLMLAPAVIVESSVFRFPEPEIDYGRGTELTVDVRLPEEFEVRPNCDETPAPVELRRLVAALPDWSYSKRQPQPMDPVNLIFAGSPQELEAAFAAAGWTGARRNSVAAGFQVIRALASEHEDLNAPMRTLLLNGDQPDLSMQTALNTFEKRDHLRIWKQADQFQGRTVWAAAATRDIGTTFSMGHPFGFTHEIQSDVDVEREKIVSDLEITGCVDSVNYIDRAQPVPTSGPGSRKGIRTDSRVAVVVLNGCDKPRENFADAGGYAGPPLAVRFFRRLTLTTRNHFIRDNIVYRSGDAARLGVLAIRSWYVHRRDERRLEQEDARHASPPAVLAASRPGA